MAMYGDDVILHSKVSIEPEALQLFKHQKLTIYRLIALTKLYRPFFAWTEGRQQGC